MAKLTNEEVEHIAGLSKLELTTEEKELYREQLSSVLSYVNQLSEVDTENVAPTANVTGLENVTRNDEIVASGFDYENIKQNAPELKDGSFVVPGVFE